MKGSAKSHDRDLAVLLEADDLSRRATHLSLASAGFAVRSYSSVDDATRDASHLNCDALLISAPLLDMVYQSQLLQNLRELKWSGRAILVIPQRTPCLALHRKPNGFDFVVESPVGWQSAANLARGTASLRY